MADTTTAVNICGGTPTQTTTSTGTPAGTDAAAQQGGGLMSMILPLAIFALIFYFFIIRPQKKQQKQHDNMLASINRGDQVETVGGFIGTIREVRDDSFQLEISDGVRVRILKSAVARKRVVNSGASASASDQEAK